MAPRLWDTDETFIVARDELGYHRCGVAADCVPVVLSRRLEDGTFVARRG